MAQAKTEGPSADPPRNVGVEEEFLLFRRSDDDLASEGDVIVREASRRDVGAQFELELKQAQVELASTPTSTVPELRRDLLRLRRELAAAADRVGARLVASGTSPDAGPARTTAKQRYQEMTDEFGSVAREQLTCGMHIHVEVRSDREAIAAINRVSRWLPVLLALSANSPFHYGRDTFYASYRTVLWGQWPTAGPTSAFADIDSYNQLKAQLVELGAAHDDGMIYFDIRRSATYPTVEIRVCDVCPDVEDAVTLAALARAMVETALRLSHEEVARPELLRAAKWRAARWGMSAELVDLPVGAKPRLVEAWDLVDELVAQLTPALDAAGDRVLVEQGLERIRALGTGAERQRAAHARHRDLGAVHDTLTVAATSVV